MAGLLSLRDELIGCTIGLSRVCSMHKKSARTDLLILQALLDSADTSSSDGTISSTLSLIKAEKSKIAPMCESCAARCGNSDDYDMSRLYNASDEIRELKLALLHKIQRMAADAIIKLRHGNLDDQTLIYFYKALFAISEDWDEHQLLDVIEETDQRTSI